MNKKYVAPRAEMMRMCTEGMIAASGGTIKLDSGSPINNENSILSSEKDPSGLWADMN